MIRRYPWMYLKNVSAGICFCAMGWQIQAQEQTDPQYLRAIAETRLPSKSDSVILYKVSTHAFSVGGSASYMYNTYLSPLHYKGWQADVLYEGYKEKPKKHLNALVQQWFVHVYGGEVQSFNKSSQALSLHMQGFWGMYFKWRLLDPLHLHLGGLTAFTAGGFYNMYNGNNPAVVNVALDLRLSYMLEYHFKIKKQAFSLRHRLSIPFAGVAFAPPYGASYYEMFMLGMPPSDYIAFTSFYNTFAMQHQLSLDFRLPNTILRLTYLGQSDWNTRHEITQRNHYHGLAFGVVYNLINISGSRSPRPGNMFGNYYQ